MARIILYIAIIFGLVFLLRRLLGRRPAGREFSLTLPEPGAVVTPAPCPFCGGRDVVARARLGADGRVEGMRMACRSCAARGPEIQTANMADALRLWNSFPRGSGNAQSQGWRNG
jgi:Lar family restriction alleviation protein